MAHFAEINDNNIVTRVIVVADEHAADGENWCNALLGGTWKQTSYNTLGGVHSLGGTPFRKNYAGVGFTYDTTRDAFIEPKPYPSWTIDEDTCQWEAPVICPTATTSNYDGKMYQWDEDITNWVEIT